MAADDNEKHLAVGGKGWGIPKLTVTTPVQPVESPAKQTPSSNRNRNWTIGVVVSLILVAAAAVALIIFLSLPTFLVGIGAGVLGLIVTLLHPGVRAWIKGAWNSIFGKSEAAEKSPMSLSERRESISANSESNVTHTTASSSQLTVEKDLDLPAVSQESQSVVSKELTSDDNDSKRAETALENLQIALSKITNDQDKPVARGPETAELKTSPVVSVSEKNKNVNSTPSVEDQKQHGKAGRDAARKALEVTPGSLQYFQREMGYVETWLGEYEAFDEKQLARHVNKSTKFLRIEKIREEWNTKKEGFGKDVHEVESALSRTEVRIQKLFAKISVLKEEEKLYQIIQKSKVDFEELDYVITEDRQNRIDQIDKYRDIRENLMIRHEHLKTAFKENKLRMLFSIDEALPEIPGNLKKQVEKDRLDLLYEAVSPYVEDVEKQVAEAKDEIDQLEVRVKLLQDYAPKVEAFKKGCEALVNEKGYLKDDLSAAQRRFAEDSKSLVADFLKCVASLAKAIGSVDVTKQEKFAEHKKTFERLTSVYGSILSSDVIALSDKECEQFDKLSEVVSKAEKRNKDSVSASAASQKSSGSLFGAWFTSESPKSSAPQQPPTTPAPQQPPTTPTKS